MQFEHVRDRYLTVLRDSRIRNDHPLDHEFDKLKSCFPDSEASGLRPDVESFTNPLFPPDFRIGYIVCITPRSGSTLLAETIGALTRARVEGYLGYPAEYFNISDHAMLARAQHYGISSFEDYAEAVAREATDASGVMSIKGDLNQLLPLFASRWFARNIHKLRFVYLTRGDLFAQAISLALAWHHQVWGDRDAVPEEFELTHDQIEEALVHVTRMMAGWEVLFAANDIYPLRTSYEQIAADLPASIQRIARFMEVEAEIDRAAIQPATRKTRNACSKRYREITRNQFRLIDHVAPRNAQADAKPPAAKSPAPKEKAAPKSAAVVRPFPRPIAAE